MKNPEKIFIFVDLHIKPKLLPVVLDQNISKGFPSILKMNVTFLNGPGVMSLLFRCRILI